RPGARRHPLRRRGRGDPPRQRDALRPRRLRLDQRHPPRPPRRPRDRFRHDLDQLAERARPADPLRRGQAVRDRARGRRLRLRLLLRDERHPGGFGNAPHPEAGNAGRELEERRMTKVDELLADGAAKVPFDVMRAAYAELLVTDLEASRHFYVDLLGMVVAEESADAIYLCAWEERLHHSLVLRRAPAAGVGRISFRVHEEGHLEPLREALEGLGATTRWVDGELSQMGKALRAWDPFGYPLEFF